MNSKIMALVASAILVLGQPAIAASHSKPCHDPKTGKFVSCSAATSSMTAAKVTKDAKGKCHNATGKYVTCPK